jgi:hypothetical protein
MTCRISKSRLLEIFAIFKLPAIMQIFAQKHLLNSIARKLFLCNYAIDTDDVTTWTAVQIVNPIWNFDASIYGCRSNILIISIFKFEYNLRTALYKEHILVHTQSAVLVKVTLANLFVGKYYGWCLCLIRKKTYEFIEQISLRSCVFSSDEMIVNNVRALQK